MARRNRARRIFLILLVLLLVFSLSKVVNVTFRVAPVDGGGSHHYYSEDTDGDGYIEGDLEGDPDSVIICHNPGGANQTLDRTPSNVPDHMEHGDTIGPCV